MPFKSLCQTINIFVTYSTDITYGLSCGRTKLFHFMAISEHYLISMMSCVVNYMIKINK